MVHRPGLWEDSSSIFAHLALPAASSRPATTFAAGADIGRARRDLPRSGATVIRCADRLRVGSGAFDGQSRGGSQRRCGPLPSRGLGSEAWRRALRPKPCKLVSHPQLRRIVDAQPVHNWSPQQIAGWLTKYPPRG